MSELRIEVDDQTADQYESATPEEQAEARAAFARALRRRRASELEEFVTRTHAAAVDRGLDAEAEARLQEDLGFGGDRG